jgi:hypothetical protein
MLLGRQWMDENMRFAPFVHGLFIDFLCSFPPLDLSAEAGCRGTMNAEIEQTDWSQGTFVCAAIRRVSQDLNVETNLPLLR